MQQNAQTVDAGAKLVVRACYDVMCFACYSIVCLGNLNFALLNKKNQDAKPGLTRFISCLYRAVVSCLSLQDKC